MFYVHQGTRPVALLSSVLPGLNNAVVKNSEVASPRDTILRRCSISVGSVMGFTTSVLVYQNNTYILIKEK